MPVEVIFTHDDVARKWECRVRGTVDAVEAVQAFSAVVLTAQQLDPELLLKTQAYPDVDGIDIIPVQWAPWPVGSGRPRGTRGSNHA